MKLLLVWSSAIFQHSRAAENLNKPSNVALYVIHCFLQARLISVCSDNSLHLWEINIKDGSSIIEHVLEFSMEAR